MPSRLRVLIEQPTRDKRWVAVAADWPGLERGGKTEAEAVEKIARYVPRYLPIAKRVRLGSELATQTKPEIIGRYRGTGSTDFWGISFAPSPLDRKPFNAPLFERNVRLLRGAVEVAAAVELATERELGRRARGFGWARLAAPDHLVGRQRESARGAF